MEAKVGARQVLLGVVALYVYSVCLAAEHTEHATMKFYYDPDTHYLVAATRSNCYIVKVTHDEGDHMHTNQGMEDIEVKMIHDWIGNLNETRVYHTDKGIPRNIGHWCGSHDMYVLTRVIVNEPTPTSPFKTTT